VEHFRQAANRLVCALAHAAGGALKLKFCFGSRAVRQTVNLLFYKCKNRASLKNAKNTNRGPTPAPEAQEGSLKEVTVFRQKIAKKPQKIFWRRGFPAKELLHGGPPNLGCLNPLNLWSNRFFYVCHKILIIEIGIFQILIFQILILSGATPQARRPPECVRGLALLLALLSPPRSNCSPVLAGGKSSKGAAEKRGAPASPRA
jgi:hypothetical protein